MPKIYLINVGANSADSSQARSALFPNGTFIFVTFPQSEGAAYPRHTCQFVKNWPDIKTHADPDWDGLTYGDNCRNPRARALLAVEQNDILLFWAMLWKMSDSGCVWDSEDKGWFLVGSLRVEYILKTNDVLKNALHDKRLRQRASRNAHTINGKVESRKDVRVFLGNPRYSTRFDRAIDLGIYQDCGLLRKTMRTTHGEKINWYKSPRWNSVLRSCRAVLDTADPLARILRDEVHEANPKFNLLKDL
jgi:hypothetical protein